MPFPMLRFRTSENKFKKIAKKIKVFCPGVVKKSRENIFNLFLKYPKVSGNAAVNAYERSGKSPDLFRKCLILLEI